ncbi:chromate transporter [Gordoniibacillus kamchatkensis]|uniref:Chromate transporter n=1 Tax=Gordoniibacillus kamchatkensis TaxID=1590651 RepID=A0ABR5AH53_9BACL|nr:chromate transporter [Paenibacillus sp. VKM B-2647]KIL40068.1 chromate transporter [Paenibacillus sp. VKM B-2647]
MLSSIFWTFAKIGLLSFGGGFSMLPLIRHETLAHGWLNESGFAEAVSVAGMAPGPIALNSAIFIGYRTAGLVGSVFAALGMLLPSVVVIVLLTAFLRRVHEHRIVRAIFYGLRPAVAALIVYAAYRLIVSGSADAAAPLWHTIVIVAMALAAFVALIRYRLHPLSIIVLSGLLGIALFS